MNNKKASAILMADWHLRDTIPECRTDDFWKAQSKKIKFIKRLQGKHSCPILCAGDVLHTAKSSPYLEQVLLNELPDFTAIPGQHDLPFHNIDKFNEGSISVLSTRFGIDIFPTPLGEIYKHSLSVGLIHTFIRKPQDLQDKQIGGESALTLLKKYKEHDLILSGDNHKTFTVEHQGRWLVNPGSIMRTTSAQKDHKPCVFLWYAETNFIEQIFFPNCDPSDISTQHIEKEKNKEERFNAFVKSLNSGYEVGSNFETSLKNYFVKNKTKESIKNLIWRWME